MNQDVDVAIVAVTKSGDGVALVFSKESAAKMGICVGDVMQVSATTDGLTIQRCDPVVQRQVEIAKQVMDERRDVLRRLAE